MLSTAVISLMYCSIQTRKRGLTADRENNMWRYLDGVSAPPAKKKKVKLIDRAEDTVDNNTNAAGDMDTGSASDGYDSGVDDASDADSDIEERRVDSLINKYL